MLVTPDDFSKLNERAFCNPTRGPLGPSYSIAVLNKLVEHIEPILVFTDAGGAATWYEYVERARGELTVAGSTTRPSEALDMLAQLAARYWKLTGDQPQRKFNFIQKADLRRVAEDDWTRLTAAGQREDAKTTAIAAGSVVEAVALDVLERLSDAEAIQLREHLNALPVDQRMKLWGKGAPVDWSFAYLLLALGPRGLNVLTEQAHVLGHTLRDWRNYVHPNKSRAEPSLAPVDGRLAAGFAEKVLADVEVWIASGAKLVVP